MTQEELQIILQDHKLWLDTNGKKGTKANFRNANLLDVNLSKADLAGVDFSDASITRANFKGTNLSGTNLEGAWIEHKFIIGLKVPFVLGNVLITGASPAQRIQTWIDMNEDNKNLLTALFL